MNEKIFTAEYTNEALEQLLDLSIKDQDKLISAVRTFERVGIAYKNINKLDYDLYELKPGRVRAYFKYSGRKIIVIGLIVLKKTQKAPKRYMEQAVRNIENYIRNEQNDNKR